MIGRSHRAAAWAVIFFLLATMVATPVARADSSDYLQGRMDGERDGKAEANQLIWGLVGFGCGIVGVGAAYLWAPSVPMGRIIGKSQEYVAAYTDSYRSAAKGAQAMAAGVGCVAWGLIYALLMSASGYYY